MSWGTTKVSGRKPLWVNRIKDEILVGCFNGSQQPHDMPASCSVWPHVVPAVGICYSSCHVPSVHARMKYIQSAAYIQGSMHSMGSVQGQRSGISSGRSAGGSLNPGSYTPQPGEAPAALLKHPEHLCLAWPACAGTRRDHAGAHCGDRPSLPHLHQGRPPLPRGHVD
jgi:hypothetical protein